MVQKIVLILLGLMAGLACQKNSVHQKVGETPGVESTSIQGSLLLTGERVYKAHCIDCHGADGTKRKGIHGESFDHFFQVVRLGKGNMPSFSQQIIGNESLGAVYAYAQNINPEKGADSQAPTEPAKEGQGAEPPQKEEGEKEPTVIEQGEKLYNKLCLDCHKEGESGADIDLPKESWGDLIWAVRWGDTGGEMDTWSEEELPDSEVKKIYLYLKSVEASSN